MLKIKLYIRVLAIFAISLQAKTNAQSTPGTCSKDMNRICGTYCYQVVKVILANAASAQSKETQFSDLQSKIKELEGIIQIKDFQLNQQIELSQIKNIIVSKDDLLNTLKSDKLLNLQHEITLNIKTINEKTNIIDQKEAELSEIKSKFDQNEIELDLIKIRIIENQNQINKLYNDINDKDKVLNDKENTLRNKESQIQTKDDQISLNTVKIKQLEDELTKYKSTPATASCLDKSTDVHMIQVPRMEEFAVSCESNFAGSGWTVIQRRIDGGVSFNRNWNEYKNGFGNLKGEFFIGLEKLYLLTKSQPHELYIYLVDFKDESRYAQYSHFVIGSEHDLYKIKLVGNYSGTAGNALQWHLNFAFSTNDRDNDNVAHDCAKSYQSGWWFINCYTCNLNGVHGEANVDHKIIAWNSWDQDKPLKHVQMMIRPKI